ncbi:serine hydrolase [bacterium]|nr:serine hydrolase [bacterium]
MIPFSSRRTFLARCSAILPAMVAGALVTDTEAADETVTPTGKSLEGLSGFDTTMQRFFEENKPLGASLAVACHGRLVYAKGFGHADLARTRAVEPTSLFRIASLTKPITSVAVFKLVEQGKVDLDQPIAPLLELDCFSGKPETWDEPRLAKVTVRNCLQHTAGFDSAISGDPLTLSHRIKAKLNIEFPLSLEDLLRFSLTRPLDFNPGERFAYSNLGFLMLGRMIEKVSGQSYEQFVTKQILEPSGISRMRLARTLPKDRAPGEVEYRDAQKRLGRNVLGGDTGKLVPFTYGAERVENLTACGGWLATSVDLVRFTSTLFFPEGKPVLSQESLKEMFAPPTIAGKSSKQPAFYACGWLVRPKRESLLPWTCWHNGGLAGVSTLLVSRADGISWAVLFNQDTAPDGQRLAAKIDPLMHVPANLVTSWPEGDLFSAYL